MEVNLKEKGTMVQALWDSVNETTGNLSIVPGLIHRVLETGAWQERIHRGKTYHNDSFLDFITAKPMRGCGWPPEKVEALLRDEPEVLTEWQNAIKVGQGARTDLDDNVNEVKPKKGTSRAYTLERLKRQRPDLFRRVVRKEMSANAAAIEAGFRKVPTPLEQIRKLLPRLTAEEWNALADEFSARRLQTASMKSRLRCSG